MRRERGVQENRLQAIDLMVVQAVIDRLEMRQEEDVPHRASKLLAIQFACIASQYHQ